MVGFITFRNERYVQASLTRISVTEANDQISGKQKTDGTHPGPQTTLSEEWQ